MKKVCLVVSTLFTARAFLLDYIAQLSRRYDLSMVANAGSVALVGDLPIRLIPVPIERKIAPLSDLQALSGLYSVFRRERFDAVHSFTPKAGFLAMLASFAARVPVRVHTFTGQVWATRSGAARLTLRTMDRIMAAAATHVIVDSPSQLAFLREHGILASDQGQVLGKGSISGVDSRRFRPDPVARAAIRNELGIPADAVIFVFVGRLSRDKGVLNLARAFRSVAQESLAAHLLLIGPDEEGLAASIREAAGPAASRVHMAGMTDAPERYMAAGDIFCLPSHREGFGVVIIEAAAVGLPAIGTRIYGIIDAIEDGRTGLLVTPRDTDALVAAMLQLAQDEPLRATLGHAARERALSDFSNATLTAELLAFYDRVLPGTTEPASRTVATGL